MGGVSATLSGLAFVASTVFYSHIQAIVKDAYKLGLEGPITERFLFNTAKTFFALIVPLLMAVSILGNKYIVVIILSVLAILHYQLRFAIRESKNKRKSGIILISYLSLILFYYANYELQKQEHYNNYLLELFAVMTLIYGIYSIFSTLRYYERKIVHFRTSDKFKINLKEVKSELQEGLHELSNYFQTLSTWCETHSSLLSSSDNDRYVLVVNAIEVINKSSKSVNTDISDILNRNPKEISYRKVINVTTCYENVMSDINKYNIELRHLIRGLVTKYGNKVETKAIKEKHPNLFKKRIRCE
jgi:hypothetical protein